MNSQSKTVIEPKIMTGMFVGLGLWTLFYGAIFFLCLPHLIISDGFILSDTGHNLHMADVLNRGGRLYADVFYNYGVLSGWSYAGWSRLFGNTAASYCEFILFLSWIFSCLGATVLYRAGRPAWVSVGWMALVLPLAGFRYIGSAFNYLEACWGLVLALIWRPAGDRTSLRLVLMGFTLGFMQLSKFGLSVILGGCLILVEAMVNFRESNPRPWFYLLREWFILAGTAGAVVLAQTVWLLLTLSKGIAWTVIWPKYNFDWYASYVTDDIRYPHWHNLGYFVGEQIGFAFLLLLGVGGAVWILWRNPRQAVLAAMGLAYLVASLTIFRHNWHYVNYLWLMMPATFFALQAMPSLVRWPFAAVFVLPWLMLARQIPHGIPSDAVLHTMPNGEKLYCNQAMLERFEKVRVLVEERRRVTGRPAVFGFHIASGLHHFYQWPAPIRSTWPAPGTMLPEDGEALLKSLDQVAAMVVWSPNGITEPPGREPNTWRLLMKKDSAVNLMPEELSRAIGKRLTGPVAVDASCWVFGVESEEKP